MSVPTSCEWLTIYLEDSTPRTFKEVRDLQEDDNCIGFSHQEDGEKTRIAAVFYYSGIVGLEMPLSAAATTKDQSEKSS